MYQDPNGNVIPNLSTDGALSVGIPGSVAGIFEVHKKFGKLPLKDLFEPSIALAKKGIIVTPKEKEKLVAIIISGFTPIDCWNDKFLST